MIGNFTSTPFYTNFSIRGKDKFGAKKEKGEVIKNKFTPYDHKVSDKVISICNKNPLTEVQTSLDQIHADVQQLIASVMDQQTETLSLLGKYKVVFVFLKLDYLDMQGSSGDSKHCQ